MAESLQLQKNPNVTVRMRGVMEKCTFCVQRVQEAKIAAKVHARDTGDVKIPTDSFTAACAQVCPTEAITFGNISDPETKVSKLRAKERGYRLLEYLNIHTRVWYLARIRNPNPKMPDAAKLGNFIKTHHHGGEEHHEAAAPGGHA
jgi:molybdopterin-containing oxidoreductase family iron-sulfur binding subunit